MTQDSQALNSCLRHCWSRGPRPLFLLEPPCAAQFDLRLLTPTAENLRCPQLLHGLDYCQVPSRRRR